MLVCLYASTASRESYECGNNKPKINLLDLYVGKNQIWINELYYQSGDEISA